MKKALVLALLVAATAIVNARPVEPVVLKFKTHER